MEILWLINLAICVFGYNTARTQRSLLTLFWLYAIYIGILAALKFVLRVVPLENEALDPAGTFVLFYCLSNGLFLSTCLLYWRLKRNRGSVPASVESSSRLLATYALLYVGGVYAYVIGAVSLDYTAFVNYEDSAWSQVLFFTGASVIPLVAARKSAVLALLLCTPYIILSVVLGVRSFLALSIFPIIAILLELGPRSALVDGTSARALATTPLRRVRVKRRFPIYFAAATAAVLLFALQGASKTKLGEVTLPEESLIEYYFTVTETVHQTSRFMGTESMERFFWGLASPLLKQGGIRYEKRDDPQAIFATYIDDYAGRLDTYFHYPSLWQADTFAAFGFGGVLLAPFWALVFLSFESLLNQNRIVWIVFLPVSCWIIFTFARGAVGNSTISVSYVLLVQCVIALAFVTATRKGRWFTFRRRP